ncbi:flagellar protein FliT [Modicisalibacter muralis]|uniref:Flagellar protein FliT n=1 Tax=Modicisalibacter muralis TaxID=119000 RepID=A0A1G9FXZ6_9GAMM|nr:flagellar protein FliT [Halomonas muralis]SDK93296.1 flagellar protein FliT [Halomonas muralis]
MPAKREAAETASSADVLAGYERLRQRSARMLGWAREGDWAHLVQEESSYVMAVEDLKRREQGCQLDQDGLMHKADLLECILEQDAEVRQRLEARRDELSELLGSTRRRRDVNRAYRASGAQPVPIDQGRR